MPYPGLLHPEPPPCGSPLLTPTSTGDAQTQFCLSLCVVSGCWCAQGLFETSECLWQVWGLILKTILPLLLSCWGFSFALGCGVSPHSHSSTAQPPLQILKDSLDEGEKGEWKAGLKLNIQKTGIQFHHFTANRKGKHGRSGRFYFIWLPNLWGQWLQPWS